MLLLLFSIKENNMALLSAVSFFPTGRKKSMKGRSNKKSEAKN